MEATEEHLCWRDWVGLSRVNEFCFRPWPSYLGTRRDVPWAYIVNHILSVLLCVATIFFSFHPSEANSVIVPTYTDLTSWRSSLIWKERNTSCRAFLPLSFLSHSSIPLATSAWPSHKGNHFSLDKKCRKNRVSAEPEELRARTGLPGIGLPQSVCNFF